jgi:arsenate reductase
MAEGWARHLGGPRVAVGSAGIDPQGLNPRAVSAMREVGIDIAQHTSDLLDPDLLNRADYVITLCGEADEACPVTPPHVRRMHWGLPDPARAAGSEEEVTGKFREVRDEIGRLVTVFLQEEVGIGGRN